MSGSTKLTPTIALRILEIKEYRCALTGRALTPETAAMDHIVPLARGGAHCASNLWVVHRDVNHAKGKLLPEEFVAMCEQIIANRDDAERLRKAATSGWRSHEPKGEEP